MFEPVQHGKGAPAAVHLTFEVGPVQVQLTLIGEATVSPSEIAGDPVNDAEHSTAGALTGVNVAVTSQPAGLVLVSLPGVDFV